MAFPSSPTNGQQHTENGRTFQYNGSNAWQLVANNSLHASTHASGGSDAITPASISAAPAANPTFTGVVTIDAGTVSAPALTTTGDTNTGVYFVGADAVAVATGGVLRQHWGSAGNIGLGTSASAARSVLVGKTITGATSAFGVIQQGAVQSDVTVGATGIYNILNAQAASFTCASYTHFLCASNALTGGAAVTTQIGYSVSSTLTGATNNYGYSGSIAAATGRWNIYMAGTAQNYFAGNVGIGTSRTTPATALDVNGVVTLALGTAAAPAIVPTGVSNCGVYFPSTSSVAISTAGTQRVAVDATGVGIGVASPGSPLDISGDNIRVRTSKTPASATDTGVAGQICWDASYVYVCISSNSWRRIAHAAW